MESFAKGDRVALKESLGPISTEEFGIVVEIYGENETPDGVVVGTKDFEVLGEQALFDYGVLFTSLTDTGLDNGSWETEKVDIIQFAVELGGRKWSNSNVIPVAHDELHFIDSELRGVFW